MATQIVIAGGGLAAQRATETLRRAGHDGPVTMVCAEPHRPYDRPPLSKDVLTARADAHSVFFRTAEWYDEHDVRLLLGVGASSLRPGERVLGLSDGSELRYDKLLIATGSRPRRLEPLDRYANVSVLRSLDDSLELGRALAAGGRIAVIGAGFIGQEVAASARGLGVGVTMIEAAPAILGHVLGEQIGGWFASLHRSRGVKVILGRAVASVVGDDTIVALRLSDGVIIEVEHVVVGVGVQPDTDWLAGSGLDGNGVPVDADGRTRNVDVFAAGDAAATYDRVLGVHVPGSHWEAASRQGARAARAMLGLDPGESPLSSFWTDQYGLRIQYLGRAPLADDVIVDGSYEAPAPEFTAIYTRAGEPIAALLVNRPSALPQARRLLAGPGAGTGAGTGAGAGTGVS